MDGQRFGRIRRLQLAMVVLIGSLWALAFAFQTPTLTCSSLLTAHRVTKDRCARLSKTQLGQATSSSDDQEAKKLLEQVRKLREEIAAMEGKSVLEVEEDARKSVAENLERQQQSLKDESKSHSASDEAAEQHGNRAGTTTGADNGRFLSPPVTGRDQVRQAAGAVERAFRDGLARQTVRLALLKDDKKGARVADAQEEWPGGAKQMYREGARPLAMDLVAQIRAPTGKAMDSPKKMYSHVKVFDRDIWDFDGSALITAEAAAGPEADLQALVMPNTDTKYLKDIQTISQAMGERLFLLVNPFWRDEESWGFNILAPNAKRLAREAVFEAPRGAYTETYCLRRFSVRGEEVAALKVYPYAWQLFAYLEDGYGGERAVRLGASEEEPGSRLFQELLDGREEFRLSRNMRELGRRF